MNIKDVVGGDKKVKFVFYRKGELWYETESCPWATAGFKFPVPIGDTGDAAFLAEDRAILFMRYIKAQLKEVEKEGSTKDLKKVDDELRIANKVDVVKFR
jgi:hypothetical protein